MTHILHQVLVQVGVLKVDCPLKEFITMKYYYEIVLLKYE